MMLARENRSESNANQPRKASSKALLMRRVFPPSSRYGFQMEARKASALAGPGNSTGDAGETCHRCLY